MKIYADTANIEEIKSIAAMGLLDGVTTNPSLVAKEAGEFKEIMYNICEVVNGPVHAEPVSLDAAPMEKESRELAAIHKNIVVKIPMTPVGLAVCKKLSNDGIPVNITLVFNPTQALLCAKAGAAYVTPFLGRLDDISNIGVEMLSDIIHIYENYDFETEILAASLRHPVHVLEAALAGADIATIPAKVFHQLFKHPLTDRGIEAFLNDWEKAKK